MRRRCSAVPRKCLEITLMRSKQFNSYCCLLLFLYFNAIVLLLFLYFNATVLLLFLEFVFWSCFFRIYFYFIFLLIASLRHTLITRLKPPVVAHFDVIRLFRPRFQLTDALWAKVRRNIQAATEYGKCLCV